MYWPKRANPQSAIPNSPRLASECRPLPE